VGSASVGGCPLNLNFTPLSALSNAERKLSKRQAEILGFFASGALGSDSTAPLIPGFL